MPLVVAKDLTKIYRLEGRGRSWRHLFHGPGADEISTPEEVAAVAGLTFEVERGEVFGLIGENGAGKSTLLRLLAGITRPTSGELGVEGTIATLLDLAAGFRPDFTGRENIRMSCQLQGMEEREISSRMEEIIGFSELASFVDRPIRTYSSGMVMRLGFSVATALASDLFLVDEVLAVGDSRFQRKCIERVKEIICGGGTIVIASHDTNTLRHLCHRALWLKDGRAEACGEVCEVADRYTDFMREQAGAALRATFAVPPPAAKVGPAGGDPSKDPPPAHPAGPTASPASIERDPFPAEPVLVASDAPVHGVRQEWLVEILKIHVHDGEGAEKSEFRTFEPLAVDVTFHAREPIDSPIFGIAIHRNDGVYCYGPNTLFDGIAPGTYHGIYTYRLLYPRLPLLTGVYRLSIGIFDREHVMPFAYLPHERTITVRTDKKDYGLVVMDHSWEIRKGGFRETRPDTE